MNLDGWLRVGLSEQQARKIALFLANKKKELKKYHPRSNHNTGSKLNGRRFANKKIRQLVKKLRGSGAMGFNVDVLISRYRPNPVLDTLIVNREKKWKPIMKRPIRGVSNTIDLKDFSFLDQPLKTIETFHELAEIECNCPDVSLNFLDNECLDIGSFLVLHQVIHTTSAMFTGGVIKSEIGEVLGAVGLVKALNWNIIKKDNSIVKDIFPFKIRIKNPRKNDESGKKYLRPSTLEGTYSDFISTINEWLALSTKKTIINKTLNTKIESMKQLSPRGKEAVFSIFAEATDNSERHAFHDNDEGNWAIVGFMNKRMINGVQRHVCQFAVYNTGLNVSESISTAPKDVLNAMESYVNLHKREKHLSEDALRTIYALQDGVTKDQVAFEEKSGGTGFMEIIEFFCGLANTECEFSREYAKLSIVSGDTCILIKNAHFTDIVGKGKGKRLLWFNEDNDKATAPSAESVKVLPHKLNGTLITMSFVIDGVVETKG